MNSAIKSANTCPLMEVLDRNGISYWLSSKAHFEMYPNASALRSADGRGYSVGTPMVCPLKVVHKFFCIHDESKDKLF